MPKPDITENADELIGDIKEKVRELKWLGEEEHDGKIIDLANILQKIIIEFKEKGREYVVRKYWHSNEEVANAKD